MHSIQLTNHSMYQQVLFYIQKLFQYSFQIII